MQHIDPGRPEEPLSEGKLVLVDLAGSERQRNSVYYTYTPALLREGFEAMQRRVDAGEEGAAAAPPPRLACESNTWWIGSRCAVTTGDGWPLCDVETG